MLSFAASVGPHKVLFDGLCRTAKIHKDLTAAVSMASRRNLIEDLVHAGFSRELPIELSPSETILHRSQSSYLQPSQLIALSWAVSYFILKRSWKKHSSRCNSCRELGKFPDCLLHSQKEGIDDISIGLPDDEVPWHRLIKKNGAKKSRSEQTEQETEESEKEEEEEEESESSNCLVPDECCFCLSGSIDPLLLKCSPIPHIMCRSCIQSIIDTQLFLLHEYAEKPNNIKIRCPTCHQVTAIPLNKGTLSLFPCDVLHQREVNKMKKALQEMVPMFKKIEKTTQNHYLQASSSLGMASNLQQKLQENLEGAFLRIESSLLCILNKRRLVLLRKINEICSLNSTSGTDSSPNSNNNATSNEELIKTLSLLVSRGNAIQEMDNSEDINRLNSSIADSLETFSEEEPKEKQTKSNTTAKQNSERLLLDIKYLHFVPSHKQELLNLIHETLQTIGNLS